MTDRFNQFCISNSHGPVNDADKDRAALRAAPPVDVDGLVKHERDYANALASSDGDTVSGAVFIDAAQSIIRLCDFASTLSAENERLKADSLKFFNWRVSVEQEHLEKMLTLSAKLYEAHAIMAEMLVGKAGARDEARAALKETGHG
jgi:hypothetical protein